MEKIINLIKEKNSAETIALTNLDILLLTAEKTGSSSFALSCTNCNLNITHLHSLHHLFFNNPEIKDIKHDLCFDDFIQYTYETYKRCPLIVSVYREPVGRMISLLLFHKLGTPMSSDDLIDEFNINYELYIGSETLKNEKIFNFINNKSYDDFKNKYYFERQNDICRVVVTRLDKLKLLKYEIEKKFSINNFEILNEAVTRNIDENKYDDFFAKLKIRKYVLDGIFCRERDIMELFYSPDEIREIENKWYKYSS